VRLFADSSALVKRYIAEPGRELVLARCAEATEILASTIALPEVLATLNRLRREGRLSGEEYTALKQRVLADMQHATIVALTPEVLAGTITSLEKAPLRAMDTIHVASALGCSPDRFLTADKRQHGAAEAMGLKSELVA
jgi:uncharacterized protein